MAESPGLERVLNILKNQGALAGVDSEHGGGICKDAGPSSEWGPKPWMVLGEGGRHLTCRFRSLWAPG